MASMKQLLFGASVILGTVLPSPCLAHSEEDFDNMGPMGFMWPHDRQWVDDEMGMTGPCGTDQGPADRTEFPLTNGALSLEQKQNVYDLQVSISFDNDPTDANDFNVLIPQERMRVMDWSHVCIDLPSISLPADADSDSTNATIRLRYTAEYVDPAHHHRRDMVKRHMASNETFYSCADVTLVPAQAFTFDIPCFNFTGNFELHGHDDHHGDSDDNSSDHDHDGGSSSGLSKGAIAGIVIGSVVGTALLAIAAWYFCRKDRREKKVAERVIYEQDKLEGAAN